MNPVRSQKTNGISKNKSMKTSNEMKKLALIVGALALPLVSFAQLTNVENLTTAFGRIVNLIIPILFAIALLGFFYGLVKYIFGAEQDKEKAKKTMLWGLIALFVMAFVWGLIYWLGSALGISQDTAPVVNPLIPRP